MVTSYGRSERIGPIDYGSDNGEVFLGRDLAAGKGYSEVKAAEIDDEIHRIIEHAYHACEKPVSYTHLVWSVPRASRADRCTLLWTVSTPWQMT